MGIEQVPLGLIEINPFQVRLGTFDLHRLANLAEDIRAHRDKLPEERRGLLQVPLARRLEDGRVQLAFGHRRRAAFDYLSEHYAGAEDWTTMPMEIIPLSDDDLAYLAWSENEHREDLTAIEKAVAFRRAMDQFGYTQTELADRWKISKSAASNLLRLLQLPDEVQQLILNRQLDEKNARTLLPLVQVAQAPAEAIRLARIAVDQGQSALQIDTNVGVLMNRLTTAAETIIIDYGNWGDLLPPGCVAKCKNCPYFGLWKHEARCARPDLYEQKYLAWQMLHQSPAQLRGPATGVKGDKVSDRSRLESQPRAIAPVADTRRVVDSEASASAAAAKVGFRTQPLNEWFVCPRCHQESVVERNSGERRTCLSCRAEWSNPEEFLKEVQELSSGHQASTDLLDSLKELIEPFQADRLAILMEAAVDSPQFMEAFQQASPEELRRAFLAVRGVRL
ncbi:MAG: hypothetical protein BroJett011_42110 [Chloroflexota bacterium]|nr:MAG: hypothetical protein BroJett011_42110 [Chloroflexota bacterium]